MGESREAEAPHLMFDGCDTAELAREYGTPLYLMSETAIASRLAELKRAFMDAYPGSLAVYASKAFMTLDICRTVAAAGLGLDVVSGGELYTAGKAGFPMDRVFFHGNGKTEEELRMAVDMGVGRVVVDNLDELEALDRLALERGRRARILFRITPGVDSHTHRHISTGQLDSKFGIPLDPSVRDAYIGRALGMKGVELMGFHFHVGSQIFENDSHVKATRIALTFMAEVKAASGFVTRELNLGGGFAVRYTEAEAPKPLSYFTDAMMAELSSGCGELRLALPRVMIEPGRWIVGEAGITLYTVTSVKEVPGLRTFVAVDGGMPDNIRPALYGAEYRAVVARGRSGAPTRTVSVVGKCCETGDVLIKEISLPLPRRGELLAVLTTGAYCHTMASNYNRLPRPAVVMVREGRHRLAVRRESYEDMMSREM